MALGQMEEQVEYTRLHLDLAAETACMVIGAGYRED
jgi:hypothetical protein